MPDEAHAYERKMDPTRCWCPFSQDILDKQNILCCPHRAKLNMEEVFLMKVKINMA